MCRKYLFTCLRVTGGLVIPSATSSFACVCRSSPVLSYNASTLVPVTPMYDNGIITAFLISSPTLQEIVPVIGNWEGPFLNLVWYACRACVE